MLDKLEPNMRAIRCDCDPDNSGIIDKYECMDCNESVEYGCQCLLDDEIDELTVYCHECEVGLIVLVSELLSDDSYIGQYLAEGSDLPAEWRYSVKCRHYNFPVTMKDETIIYASSNWDREDHEETPDFGLYLDSVWQAPCLAYFLDWQDFGLPARWEIAAYTIIDVYRKARDFGLWVEVGCIGGHGRTGTVLACMAVLGGENYAEAIARVRNTYCKEAIETKEQIWFVEWFDCFINGGKTSPMPPVGDDKGGSTYKFEGSFQWEAYSPIDFPKGEPKVVIENTEYTRFKYTVTDGKIGEFEILSDDEIREQELAEMAELMEEV